MNDSGAELREQLVELQTQLAFQEDALRALDAVVTDQQQRLDRLTQLSARLERQFGELVARGDEPADEAPPPHY